MDTGTQKNKKTNKRNFGITGGQNKNACENPTKKNQKVLTVGESFTKTILHFWPKLSERLGVIHDSRYQPFIVYKKEFLLWWGLLLFVFKLSSKRQLDYDLRDIDTFVLENINRLAGTDQKTLPVHKTLSHFLEHVGSKNVFKILIYLVRRLIRMKALDGSRMEGAFVVAIDGTGYLFFKKKHCDTCIVHIHENQTYYFHPVLEAKIVDPRGFALSVGSEFIENDADTFEEYAKKKQDCELNAFKRLAPTLKSYFPQTPLCMAGDSLYACGPTIQICNENKWHYVLTLKKGRLTSVWKDVQGLLKLCPENTLRLALPDTTIQEYRWVNDVDYQDSQKRMHSFDVIICTETNQKETKTYAWITDYHITANNVVQIATQGGRVRSKIENQGFNIQKNSGLNLEHAYSFDPDVLKSFYYLLQMAHIMLQMVEKGSLLKNLAQQFGKSVIGLFGSLKNIARRLLECFRNYYIPDEAFDRLMVAQIQIRLDSS